MSKDVVAWRKKEVVELTKDAVEHVVVASHKSSNNNKVVKQYLSKDLPPIKEHKLFVRLMGMRPDAQTPISPLLATRRSAFL